MDKRIEELVDKWARQLALQKDGGTEEELYPHWITKAKSEIMDWISGEPNLALIDEDQSYPDMYFFCPDCKKTQVNHDCNIVEGETWRRVVQITETLEEE